MDEMEAAAAANKYLRVAATLVRQAADLIRKFDLHHTAHGNSPAPIALDENLIADLQLSLPALQPARQTKEARSDDSELNGAFTKWGQEERRQDSRVALTLEVRWDGLSEEDKASTSNLSGDGCYVESPVPVAVGEQFPLEIKVPTGRWVRLDGKVTYHQPMAGFGVRFINLSELEREILALLIDYTRRGRRSKGAAA